MGKEKISSGISTTILMAAAKAVQAMLRPPMQMHEILHRHMESLLSEQRVNIARALRFQIDYKKISEEQLLSLAVAIEKGLEMIEYDKPKSSEAPVTPSSTPQAEQHKP